MTDYSADDPLPGIKAAVDQAIAEMPDLARMAHGYFEAFLAQGFSDRQALYLTACQLHTSPGNAPS